MDTFNKVRLKVWRQQPDAFFRGSGSGGGRDIGPNHRRMQRTGWTWPTTGHGVITHC